MKLVHSELAFIPDYFFSFWCDFIYGGTDYDINIAIWPRFIWQLILELTLTVPSFMWVFHEYVTERVCDNVLFHREFDIFLKNCYISKTVGDRAFLKHCKRNMKWNLNFKSWAWNNLSLSYVPATAAGVWTKFKQGHDSDRSFQYTVLHDPHFEPSWITNGVKTEPCLFACTLGDLTDHDSPALSFLLSSVVSLFPPHFSHTHIIYSVLDIAFKTLLCSRWIKFRGTLFFPSKVCSFASRQSLCLTDYIQFIRVDRNICRPFCVPGEE